MTSAPSTEQVAQLLRASSSRSPSRAAIQGLLDGYQLVASGLRLAYLVDTILIPECALSPLAKLLHPLKPSQADVFLLHEQSTQTTFIVNIALAASLSLNLDAINIIDVRDPSQLAKPDHRLSAVLADWLARIKTYAAELVSLKDGHKDSVLRLTIDVKSVKGVQNASDTQMRCVMVAFTGVVLEYPFAYYDSSSLTLDTPMENALSGLHLVLIRAQAQTVDQSDMLVLSFSVPQVFKDNNLGVFDQTIAGLKHKLAQRIAASDHQQDYTLRWSVQERVLQNRIAL